MSSMPKFVDYYAILGVPVEASEVELRVAYRRAALALHPDKTSDPNATSMFQMVSNPRPILPL